MATRTPTATTLTSTRMITRRLVPSGRSAAMSFGATEVSFGIRSTVDRDCEAAMNSDEGQGFRAASS